MQELKTVHSCWCQVCLPLLQKATSSRQLKMLTHTGLGEPLVYSFGRTNLLFSNKLHHFSFQLITQRTREASTLRKWSQLRLFQIIGRVPYAFVGKHTLRFVFLFECHQTEACYAGDIHCKCLLVTVCSVFPTPTSSFPFPCTSFPFPWESHGNPMKPVGSQSSPFPCNSFTFPSHGWSYSHFHGNPMRIPWDSWGPSLPFPMHFPIPIPWLILFPFPWEFYGTHRIPVFPIRMHISNLKWSVLLTASSGYRTKGHSMKFQVPSPANVLFSNGTVCNRVLLKLVQSHRTRRFDNYTTYGH